MAYKNIVAIALALAILAGCHDNQPIESPQFYAPDNAQSPISDASGLQDYLVYAALNNSGLQAEFNLWQAALHRAAQVSSLPDPRFSYRYFIREIETRVGAQRQAFEISQMFPWFGKLELRASVAMQAAYAQQQRYEAAKLKLFFEVKNAYYEYYYLSKAIAVNQENVNLLQHLESVARTRYKTAAGSHPDIIRAQVELGKLEDQLLALQGRRTPIVARLNATLNRSTGAALPWPRDFEVEAVAVSDEELLAWLADGNPELKALGFEVAKRQHGVELANKSYYPDISVGVNYVDTANSTGGRDPSDDGKDAVAGMVSVNIPIWRDKYAAGVREAKSRRYAAMHTMQERANTLSAKLQLVLFELRDAERKIDLYRNGLIPKAEQAMKVTESSFRAGQSSFLDQIDAQRILLQFQLAYERAVADHEQARAKLEMLVGRNIGSSQ
jgi:cobalt-zinc-cadmium efflux system outer membrane protein